MDAHPEIDETLELVSTGSNTSPRMSPNPSEVESQHTRVASVEPAGHGCDSGDRVVEDLMEAPDRNIRSLSEYVPEGDGNEFDIFKPQNRDTMTSDHEGGLVPIPHHYLYP